MDTQREIFTEGAVGRGIDRDKAVEVFELMAKFADYGFNKSHAAAYALVSYQTAWMKANHPVAFLAACMSLAREKTDKLAALRQEAERLGVKVLPPDINRSGADFSVEVAENGIQSIRYALAAVKKVGLAAMQAVEVARGATSFADLADFAQRVEPRQLNKMQIENLAKAGAFDSLDANRARVFGAAETMLRRAQAQAEEAASGQIGLFGGGARHSTTLRIADVADWPGIERLGLEADAIGFHLTGHPLDAYAPLLRRLGTVKANALETAGQAGIGRVKIAGCIIDRKERPTRTGTKMAWVRLSDSSGACEVTFFSEVLSRTRDVLVAGQAVLVTADLRMEGEMLRVTAQDAVSLDKAAAEDKGEMRIWIDRPAAIETIRGLLNREKGGRGRIVLLPCLDETQDVEVALPEAYMVTPRLAQALKLVSGVARVEER
jgi:DNA polymerase-3 subunit alpha